MKNLAIITALTLLSACVENDPIKRIEAGCQREFGYRGELAVSECQVNLLLSLAREQHKDRMNMASR